MSNLEAWDPRRPETILVGGEPVVVDLGVPLSIMADAESNNGDRLVRALRAIVLEHPFTRADGEKATVDDFGRGLAKAILEGWAEALRALPLASGRPSSPPSVSGSAVNSVEYAMHHLALRAGRFPWELRAMDPPAADVARALAIDEADAVGRQRARKRDASRGSGSRRHA